MRIKNKTMGWIILISLVLLLIVIFYPMNGSKSLASSLSGVIRDAYCGATYNANSNCVNSLSVSSNITPTTDGVVIAGVSSSPIDFVQSESSAQALRGPQGEPGPQGIQGIQVSRVRLVHRV